jgi:hypothetical protein
MNIGPLIERADSPQINGVGNERTITRIFNVSKGVDIDLYIPQKNSLSPDGDGYFQNATQKSAPGYDIVTFTYVASFATPNNKERGRRNNSIEYDFNINIVEKPLETHPDYRTKWNYDLYGWSANTTPPSAPAFWTSATDKSGADGVAASGGFYWGQTRPPDPKEGYWHKIKDRTKAGVEAYIIPQPVITARKFCKSEDVAVAFLPSTIAKSAPGNTFGWSSSDAKWLKSPVGIQNDGEFFVAHVEYQYADSWDSEIYD